MFNVLQQILNRFKRPPPGSEEELSNAQRRLELLEMRHSIYVREPSENDK